MRAVTAGLLVLASGCSAPRDVVSYPPAAPPPPVTTPSDSGFASIVPASAVGPADPDATMTYWKGVREIAQRKPSKDLTALLKQYKQSVEEVRKLPAVGVDAELLAHAENVARRLERFVSLGEFVSEHPREARHVSGMPRSLLDAAGQANDATSQLKGLRARLSNRYGTEFPPIEEPK